MHRSLLFSAACLLSLPFSAQAGEYYYGVMLGNTTYEQSGASISSGAVSGKLGYRHNDWLSAEVHAGIGGGGSANSVDYDLNWLTSAFVKLSWAAVDDGRIRLYALGGYSAAEMEFTNATTISTASVDGASFLIGMDLFANRNHGIFIQAGRYLDGNLSAGSAYTLDGISLGYISNF